MDRMLDHQHFFQHLDRSVIATNIAYGIAFLYLVHQLLVYLNYPILSPQELLWNAFVYFIPKYVLLDRARRQELQANDMLSQTHAAKSEALRRMLGVGGNAMMQSLPADGIMRRASGFARPSKPTSDAPAGLGNWDNSCYQNSVLQGLASLQSMRPYLTNIGTLEDGSTTGSLLETIDKLNDHYNNGKQLWTPAKLKSMSSWQQQDAQEYFSKIMDELDKEAIKASAASKSKPGLESLGENPTESAEQQTKEETPPEPSSGQRSPLDGLLAQKVTCTRCNYSEGYSMIPFNCLTVPLGSSNLYSVDQCLDEYTKLEEIDSVECSKCTLLRAEKQLQQMLPGPPNYRSMDAVPAADSKTLELPPELRAQAFKRLRAIQVALQEDDYSDKTLNEACAIPKKGRASSTKTKQAVIGRAPQSLVVHVNRSVFDEMTGVQRKNYATVRYPPVIDLGPWMLSTDEETPGSSDHGDASAEDNGWEDAEEHAMYRIKAVVTHYGRHENGHYICYRQHSVPKSEGESSPDDDAEEPSSDPRWWRLSDETVSPVTEEDVLAQGGVFMLFYERESSKSLDSKDDSTAANENAEVAEILESPTARGDDDDEHNVLVQPNAPDSGSEDVSDEPPATPSLKTDDTDVSTSAAPSDPPTPSSTNPTAKDQVELESEGQTPPDARPIDQKPSTSPPLMRTSRGRQSSKSEKDHFGGNTAFRAVAAT